MSLPLPTHGLYAITGDGLGDDALLAAVAAAIRGGAALVQYRDKRSAPAAQLQLGQRLLQLCRAHRVALIVNDDVALAARLGADGVHLGKDDADPAAAREALGNDAIVGVSCYDSLERARRAQALGASYAAFGRFFPSGSKPQATPASLNTLRQARAELSLPLAAIGGVTPDNGAALLMAGADFLCAIEGVFGQADVESAARAYCRLFSNYRQLGLNWATQVSQP